MERLQQQIAFILELDKLKAVLRRTKPTGLERQENTAEHSWHIATLALVMAEYANEPVDMSHVVKMLLVHDIVEIDADDTMIYDVAANADKWERESRAAERLFGLLPAAQGAEFKALWLEYEAQSTPEARFAKVADRLMPILHNYHRQGEGWLIHKVRAHQVRQVNSVIDHGSNELWAFVQSLIDDAVAKGYLAE
ncbi:MAG: HD domain-containing protein [Caldilineaceae bacterium]|nr:HD domain-containing protein [Caldilineaceae bacterium]